MCETLSQDLMINQWRKQKSFSPWSLHSGGRCRQWVINIICDDIAWYVEVDNPLKQNKEQDWTQLEQGLGIKSVESWT